MKKIIIALLVMPLLMLTGCRMRTTVSNIGDGSKRGEAEVIAADGSDSVFGDDGRSTQHSEAAQRREYDENASAEITDASRNSISSDGEGTAGAFEAEDADRTDSLLNDEAGKRAVQTVAADEADSMGTNENAAPAETVLNYYNVLLRERTRSLFECQRSYVYLELTDEYHTVYRNSDWHRMITDAGAYDVSSRLTEEGLTVNAGWVLRKDPDVIVKIVGGNVLGKNTENAAMAKSMTASIKTRPEWNGIKAVRGGRIILLSEEMFDNESLKTGALIYIAKMAAPSAFEDINADEALKALMEEAGIVNGVYAYCEGDI